MKPFLLAASIPLFISATMSQADICRPEVWGSMAKLTSGGDQSYFWMESSEFVGDQARMIAGWSFGGPYINTWERFEGTGIWRTDGCVKSDPNSPFVFRATVVDAYAFGQTPLESPIGIYGFLPSEAHITEATCFDAGELLATLVIPTAGDFFAVIDEFIVGAKAAGAPYVGINIRVLDERPPQVVSYEFTAGTPNHYGESLAGSLSAFDTLSSGQSFSAIGSANDFGIPEPASLSLLALAGTCLTVCRHARRV